MARYFDMFSKEISKEEYESYVPILRKFLESMPKTNQTLCR
ncbi:hypothetical protein AM416_003838 [Acinetobacter baumannii]|nr:hypothetical protein AM416_003838 [Acinetobacter baumannii]